MNRERLAFAVLAFVQASLIAAISLVAVALPAIQREWGLSELQLTLVTAGYGIAFSGLLILGGRLGDLFGPRAAFAAGMALFGAASVAGSAAAGVGPLLAARFGQGVGASLAAPAALTLAAALFSDPDERTRALAVWGGLSATGAVAGMLLSGGITEWLGWRWVFAPPAFAAVLALAAVPALLPRAACTARPRLDVLGAALATAGLSAVTYGLLALTAEGGRAAGWAVATLGGALIALFLWVEGRVPHPLVPLGFLKGRRLLALGAIALASAVSAATNFFLSLFLQQLRGLSPMETALYFLPMALIVVAGRVAGSIIRRSGPEHAAAAGLGCTASGLFLIGLWMVETVPEAVAPGLVLFPAGLGLLFSGAVVAALESVPAGDRGLAGGVVNTAMEVGPTVGLAAMVALGRFRASALMRGGSPAADAAAGGYALALWAAAALSLLVLVGFFAAFRRVRGVAAGAPAFRRN